MATVRASSKTRSSAKGLTKAAKALTEVTSIETPVEVIEDPTEDTPVETPVEVIEDPTEDTPVETPVEVIEDPTEATPTEASVIPRSSPFSYRIGKEYSAIIDWIPGSAASYQLMSASGAVVAKKEGIEDYAFEYEGLKPVFKEAGKVAICEAIAAYNDLFPLKSGEEVDITRLFPSFLNEAVYDENNALEDLVKIIKQGEKFDPIWVLPTGETLRGNTRLKAAVIAAKEGGSQEGITLEVRVVDLPAETEDMDALKLEFIRVGNTAREKTSADKDREVAIATRAIAVDSLELSKKGKLGSITKRIVETAQDLGMSPRKVESLVAYEKIAPELSKPLRKELEKIKAAAPNNALAIARLEESNDYKLTIAKAITNSPKPISFKEAKAQVDKKTALDKLEKEEGKSDRSRLIKKALEEGDKANFVVPKEIYQVVAETMKVDVHGWLPLYEESPFLEAKVFPELLSLEKALKGEWESSVFAFPSPDQAKEVLVWLTAGLRQKGGIEKLCVILPAEIFGSAIFRQMLEDFNPLVCYPEPNIKFEPGELAKVQSPGIKALSLSVIAVFYSSDRKDVATFARLFPGWAATSWNDSGN